MKLFRILLLSAVIGAVPALQAADPPRVEVTFGDLSKFTDLRNSSMVSPKEREALANVLKKHLEREAPDRIPADTRLVVHVTDVDMAGDFRFNGAGGNDVRIVKDMFPPRIELDFKLLRADGTVEKEGHRLLRDPSFMWGSSPTGAEQLKFEKALLDNWLAREFAPPKPANANR